MERCISGKRIYESESIAIAALIQNHIRNNYRKNEGPINIYNCLDCNRWHFTSKGEKHPLFDDQETMRTIEQEKRAHNWERGFK